MEKPDEILIINKNRQTKETVFKHSFVFLFAIFIIIDQASKYFAPNIYQNHFFAFSLPVNFYAMYAVYFFGIAGIIFYLIKHFENLSVRVLAAWTLILSGAFSNVGERIILGFARDWIYIGSGIFNLADGYIIVGIIMLILNPKSEKLNPKQITNSKISKF